MSKAYGTIRVVVTLDDHVEIDETCLNNEPQIMRIAKAFHVEVFGREHRVDVEFHFDPPLEVGT